MASFAFRLLIAKLPSYFGSHKIALDRLTDCLIVCKVGCVLWHMYECVLCKLTFQHTLFGRKSNSTMALSPTRKKRKYFGQNVNKPFYMH